MTGRVFLVASAFIATMTLAAWAEDFRLAPYKDEHFAYPKIIGTQYDGDLVMVEFNKERDINGRDEIPLKKAWDKMVSLDANELKQDLTLNAGEFSTKFLSVGEINENAKIVVIFMHGLHGDRHLSMEDHRWGGNFNRLKNLMVQNDGIFVSPDFSGFGKRAANQITALMKFFDKTAPGVPIIVGCASTSCKTAYRMLGEPESAALMSGAVMFGASKSDGFLKSATIRDPSKWVPIYFGHGSDDKTNDWVTVELMFKRIKEAAPGYPLKFDLFLEGVHGTPIRMSDWRLVLNWMLEVHQAKADPALPVVR